MNAHALSVLECSHLRRYSCADPEFPTYGSPVVEFDPEGRYAATDHLASGDYHPNGSVGLANVRAWQAAFEDSRGVWWHLVRYGYGGQQVFIDLEHPDFPEEAGDILRNLEVYPLVDEDVHSEVEFELRTEWWDAWGREEFREALAHVSGLPIDLVTDDADELETAFSDASGHLGTDATIEQLGAFLPKEDMRRVASHIIEKRD